MLKVGLTGGLSSGKSTVASMLRTLGAEVVEADELGRALMEPGQLVFSEIVRVFGPEVVGPNGRLNRARLAEMAFQCGRLNGCNGRRKRRFFGFKKGRFDSLLTAFDRL